MNSKSPKNLRPETIVITAGRPEVGPDSLLNQPISLNSTFVAGGEVGYGRYGNETWLALEEAISALEGGRTLAYSSGMAAVTAVFSTLPVGAKVIASNEGYSGTMTLLNNYATANRLKVSFVSVTNTSEVINELPGATLLWIESPTNPGLEVADLPALIKAAKDKGVTVAVDNTFATALSQKPLALGAVSGKPCPACALGADRLWPAPQRQCACAAAADRRAVPDQGLAGTAGDSFGPCHHLFRNRPPYWPSQGGAGGRHSGGAQSDQPADPLPPRPAQIGGLGWLSLGLAGEARHSGMGIGAGGCRALTAM